MSDGITEARKGTYWGKKPTPTPTDNSNYLLSIMNPELYGKIMKKKKIKYSTDLKHMPNQKWHKYVSFIKSGVRIIGYFSLLVNPIAAVCFLIASEIIGIIEELV